MKEDFVLTPGIFNFTPDENLIMTLGDKININFECVSCGKTNNLDTPYFTQGGFDCGFCKTTNLIIR